MYSHAYRGQRTSLDAMPKVPTQIELWDRVSHWLADQQVSGIMLSPPTQLRSYKHHITMLAYPSPHFFLNVSSGAQPKWLQSSDFATSCPSSFLSLHNSPWSPRSRGHHWVDLQVLPLPLWSEAPRICLPRNNCFKIQEKLQHSVHWEICVSRKVILRPYLLLQWIKWDVWAYCWI